MNGYLSGNDAFQGGAAIHNNGGTLTVSNSILANSRQGEDVFGLFTGSNNLLGGVLLGPLQDNGGPTQTQVPLDGRAIDAGNNNLIPAGVTTDQRGPGFPRVFNGTVDIGAFERQSLGGNATTTTITSTANSSTYGQPGTLTATVRSASGTPTGIVEFLDGSVLLATPSLVNGVAQFVTSSLAVGIHHITALYNGDADFYISTSAALTQTVNKADQTITFEAPADGAYRRDPFTLSATASSGLPVSFAVLSGPATVNGNSLTVTGVGTVVIEASQPGDGNYNASPVVDRSFTVTHWTRVGSLDPTFGDGGQETIDFYNQVTQYWGTPPSDDFATGVAVQPDGSILVGGTNPRLSNYGVYLTAELSPSGGVNYETDTLPGFSTPTAVQADGKTLVVGASNGNFLVRRYNTDNTLDTSFGNGGTVAIDFGTGYDVATGVAVQPDGKIVVVGYSRQCRRSRLLM